jgi:hypothetical protein
MLQERQKATRRRGRWWTLWLLPALFLDTKLVELVCHACLCLALTFRKRIKVFTELECTRNDLNQKLAAIQSRHAGGRLAFLQVRRGLFQRCSTSFQNGVDQCDGIISFWW